MLFLSRRLCLIALLMNEKNISTSGLLGKFISIVSDIFHKQSVNSVTGIGDLLEAISGAILTVSNGYIISWIFAFVDLCQPRLPVGPAHHSPNSTKLESAKLHAV